MLSRQSKLSVRSMNTDVSALVTEGRETSAVAIFHLGEVNLDSSDRSTTVGSVGESVAGLIDVLCYCGCAKSQAIVNGERGDEARPHLIEARERFEELGVVPGIVDADIWLGLVERDAGDLASARERFEMALASSDEHWFAEASYWLAQLTASVIDDQATAATLLGAAVSAYDRLDTEQSSFIVHDLESTRTALAASSDPDDFARYLRAGARRSQAEMADIARAALLDPGA